MKEERDIVDDLFRKKLHDFEAEPMPDLWEAIADRLPQEEPLRVPLRRRVWYWAAAAVVALLVVSGGLYLHDRTLPEQPLAEQHMDTNSQEDLMEVIPSPERAVEEVKSVSKPGARPLLAVVSRQVVADEASVSDEAAVPEVPVAEVETGEEETPVVTKSVENATQSALQPMQLRARGGEASKRSAAQTGKSVKRQKKEASKWSFGMGAGGVSVGSNNSVPSYVTNSTVLRSESLLIMNSSNFDAATSETPKTDIRHRTPVSFGLSVSRSLGGRFSLQSGINYSYLVSEWNTNNDYYVKTKQKLHFIGIPLSLAYRIAEWNRFNFYASAGGMAEVNVAGSRSAKLFKEEQEVTQLNESVRMKEWLWSVNARVGVSYPLIRFVSAFAEVGAGYYFDNGSEIETIHSEKPFNVDLSIGLRLGF